MDWILKYLLGHPPSASGYSEQALSDDTIPRLDHIGGGPTFNGSGEKIGGAPLPDVR